MHRCDESEKLLEKNIPLIEALVDKDELANALAEKMDELQTERLAEGNYVFSRAQARIAIIGLPLLYIGTVLGILASAGKL
jgi:hypothetical protein